MAERLLQPRVDRLALEGEDTEGTLVNAVEGLFVDEAVQGLRAS